MSRWRLSSLFVVLSVAGCFGEDSAGGSACTDSDQCDMGQYCHDGTCRSLCQRDDDCPPGLFVCNASGICAVPANPDCTTAGECTSPPTAYPICFTAVCVRGSCRYDAEPTVECAGAACVNGFAIAARVCGSQGLCPPPDPVGQTCAGYSCNDDGVTCRTTCSEPGHCLGGLQCQGDQSCEPPRLKGAPCVFNAECATLACECADAACATQVCAAADCGTCRYATAAGDCLTLALNDDVADPEECSDQAVCDAGSCVLFDDQSCTADAECQSGHCECVDATCTARRCNQSDCPCQFNNDADDFCDGNLSSGTEDVLEACTAPQICDGNGACRLDQPLAEGETGCVTDEDCASGNCDTSASNASEIGRCCSASNPNTRAGTGGLVIYGGGTHCCDADMDCGAGNYCRASTFQCVTGATDGGAAGNGACDDLDDCDSGATYCCDWGNYDDCPDPGADCRCAASVCP